LKVVGLGDPMIESIFPGPIVTPCNDIMFPN
jgi:hypothetical protein